MRRLLALSTFGAVLAGASLGTGIARADANCETIHWPALFNWGQVRTICDNPIAADGSWVRGRMIWTPAHQVPFTCSGGYYYSSCSGGYFVGDTIAEETAYPVTADTVLPNEPGYLGGVGPVVAR